MVTTLLLGLLVFVAYAAIDFAATRYIQAVHTGERFRAAAWSVVQWSAASVGFVIAVKVTLWVLPFEAAGLWVGTVLAMHRSKLPEKVTDSKVT